MRGREVDGSGLNKLEDERGLLTASCAPLLHTKAWQPPMLHPSQLSSRSTGEDVSKLRLGGSSKGQNAGYMVRVAETKDMDCDCQRLVISGSPRVARGLAN